VKSSREGMKPISVKISVFDLNDAPMSQIIGYSITRPTTPSAR